MGSERQAGLTAAGVHFVKSVRPGKPIKWYVYAWRGGPQIRAAEQPDKPRLTKADLTAIGDALREQDRPANTIKGLSTLWQRSREWKALADSTRTTWGYSLAAIETKWPEVPLTVAGDPRFTAKIVKWRDAQAEARGLRAADMGVVVLSQMFAWAQLNGLVMCNPAAPVPALWKGGNREEIIWLPEDCAAFDATEDLPLRLYDARRIAEFTGFRCADICTVKLEEVFDTHLGRTASKKSRGKRRRTIMPKIPGLAELVEELKGRFRLPGVTNLLVGAKGGPLAPRSLSIEFSKWRGRANDGQGIWHKSPYDDEPNRTKTLHDLRGTFATKLMTLPGGGLTDEQIATIMGWSPQQVAAIRKRYVDEAAIVVAIGKRIAEGM